ncbi:MULTISPECIES: hypothetical protein [unclassified Caballeronia]|uniref:hypothetical protein n=1 Tax=unclassified Caballeronia TaxID=2646786 RepID=UPI002029266D|nr:MULTISPECIES: hypothetical protein [unclassified Caballeronia]
MIECLIDEYLHLRPLLIDRYAEPIEKLRATLMRRLLELLGDEARPAGEDR